MTNSVTETFVSSQDQAVKDQIEERKAQRKQQRIAAGNTTPAEKQVLEAEASAPITREEVAAKLQTSLNPEHKPAGPAETVAKNVAEIPRAVVSGVQNAGQEFLDTTNEMAAWLDENVLDMRMGDPEGKPLLRLPEIAEPDTATGQVVQAFSQFATGFALTGKLKGVKAIKSGFGKAMVKGAGADAGFMPHDQRLADLVQSVPALENPITEYLAADPGDSTAEQKFKNSLEGLALGAAFEPLVRGVALGIKAYRAAGHARRAAGAEADAARVVTETKEAEKTAAAYKKAMGGDEPEPVVAAGTKANKHKEFFLQEDVRVEKGDPRFSGSTEQTIGPGAKINVVKQRNLADIVDSEAVYHETNLANAKSIIGRVEQGQRGMDGVFVSDNLDLALGQKGRGYVLEFDPKMVNGKKAGTLGGAVAEDLGAGGEYVVNKSVRGSLKAIIAPTEKGVDALKNIKGIENRFDFSAAEKVERGWRIPRKAPKRLPEAAGIGRANINYNKLETEQDVKDLIDRYAKKQGQAESRGTVTDEELMKAATDLGLDADEVMARQVGETFAPEKMLAARNLMVDMGEDLATKAKDFQARGLANVPDTEKAAFMVQTQKFRGVMAQVQGATAESGRLLRQFRLPASSKMQADALKGLVNDSASLDNVVDLFAKSDGKQVQQMIKLLGREQARHAIPGFTEGAGPIAQIKNSLGMLEAAGYRLWVNGLLSALPTQVINVAGTGSYMGIRAGRLWATSRFNRRFPSVDPDTMSSGEVQSRLQGLRMSIPESWAVARESYKQNLPVGAAKFTSRTTVASPFATKTPDEIGIEGIFAKGIYYLSRGLDQGVTRPLEMIGARAMNAEDAFFKTMIGNMEVNGLSYRQALTEGLEEGSEAFVGRVAFLKSNPPKWMMGEAQRAADEITFTNAPYSSGGRKVVQLAGDVPGVRWFGVFARTAGNLFSRGAIGETPLTMFSARTREALAAGGASGEEAASRVAMASVVSMTVADATLNGVITGAGPSDPRMRQYLERSGWKPNSINIGKMMGGKDSYIDYSRFDPMAWPLTINATMAEIVMWGGDRFSIEEEDMQTEMLASVANLLSDRTYVRGISDLFGALALPKEWQARRLGDIFENMAATLAAPSVSFKVRQQVDQYRRWAPGMLDKWRNRTPMLSESQPVLRGIFGEPMFYAPTLGPAFVSPIATADQTVNVDYLMDSVSEGVYKPNVPSLVEKIPMIYAEMAEAGAPIQSLPKNLGGFVDISTPENVGAYGKYMELVGTTKIDGKDILESSWALMQHPEYQARAFPQGRAKLWRNLVNGYRKQAMGELLADPEYRDLALEYVTNKTLNNIKVGASKQQVQEMTQ